MAHDFISLQIRGILQLFRVKFNIGRSQDKLCITLSNLVFLYFVVHTSLCDAFKINKLIPLLTATYLSQTGANSQELITNKKIMKKYNNMHSMIGQKCNLRNKRNCIHLINATL